MSQLRSQARSRRGALVALLIVVVAAIAALGWSRLRAKPPAPAAAPTTASEAGVAGPRRGDATLALRGVVVGPDGAPFAGAIVSATPRTRGGAPLHATTGAAGTFALTAPAGRYELRAAASGHVQAATVVVDAPADDVTLTLAAATTGLRGTVRDAESGPIAGAWVRARPLHAPGAAPATVETDADGRYALALPPGRYDVEVAHEAYAPARRRAAIRATFRQEDFVLVAGSAIVGHVRRADTGAPVADACVRAERDDSTEGILPSADPCLWTDADGAFEVSGLAPGVTTLTASAPGLGTWTPARVALGVAETRTDVVLLVSAAHDIAGDVHDLAGASVPGVVVVAMRPEDLGGVSARTISDPAGAFTFTGLTPGRYIVRVEPAPGAIAGDGVPVEVPSAVRVTVTVDRGHAIRGRVEPARPGRVTVRAAPDGLGLEDVPAVVAVEAMATAEIGADGRFEVTGIRDGRWQVRAEVDDPAAGLVSVEVAGRDVDDVVVRLDERATLCGRVVDTAGAPVTDAVVTAMPGNARSPAARVLAAVRLELGELVPVDEAGAFCLTNLPAGPTHVLARSPHDLYAWGKRHLDANNHLLAVELAAGERRDGYVLEIDVAVTPLTGQVVDADGRPVADAIVRITGRTDSGDRPTEVPALHAFTPPAPVITDGAGRFSIDVRRPTPYTLVATHAGRGLRGEVTGAVPGTPVVIATRGAGALRGAAGAAGSGGCRVRVHGPVDVTVASADPRCAFTVDALPAGRYAVEVTRGVAVGRASVEIAPGATAEATVDLVDRVPVRVRFVDPGGAPVARVGVLVLPGDLAGADTQIMQLLVGGLTRTDADGAVTALAAPGPGLLLALAPAGDRPLHHQTVEIPDTGADLGTIAVTP